MGRCHQHHCHTPCKCTQCLYLPVTSLLHRQTHSLRQPTLITKWLSYCDQHAHQGGQNLSRYAVAFDAEGFVTIDQLVGPHINIEKLSEWLGIRKGTADLILRYTETDIGLVKA